MRATAEGDLETVLSLIAEDAIFLLPDQPPMRGREAFAGALRSALGQFVSKANRILRRFMSLETTPFTGISFLWR
jgi:ketosteroid isomerase-like protein